MQDVEKKARTRQQWEADEASTDIDRCAEERRFAKKIFKCRLEIGEQQISGSVCIAVFLRTHAWQLLRICQ